MDSKKISIIISVFTVSMLLGWGAVVLEKNLEEILFLRKISQNPQILTGRIPQQELQNLIRNSTPFRNWEIGDLELEAKAAISVEIKDKNQQKILFKKKSNEKLPIASLTKLMTAYVATENYDLNLPIEITKEAVEQEGNAGYLRIGEKLTVENLLYVSLIESSNDAAYALSQIVGQNTFVDLMNLEAKKMGLKNTYFINPTGLDTDNPEDAINYSTCEDLAKFVTFLFEKPLILEILSKPEFELYTPDGILHHKLKNTNELLGEIPLVLGGKTGWTPRARGCFLLILKSHKKNNYLVNVILGSENKFEEMKKLIEWVDKAYKW